MEMVNDKISINSELTFNIPKRTLINKDNKHYVLGKNEYRILQLMVSNPNRVISRKEIYHHVWHQRGMRVEDSSLTQAISSLRKYLGDSIKKPRFIITEPRVGYRFIATLSAVEDERSPASNKAEGVSSTSQHKIQRTAPQVNRSEYWRYFITTSLLIMLALIIFDVDDSQTALRYLAKKISVL